MASSLHKLIAAAASYNPLKSVRSVVLFRPVTAASTRLFNTKLGIQPDGSGECNFKLKNDGSYTTDVPDVFNSYFMYQILFRGHHDSSNVICPRLSATGNLFRLLYLMDCRFGYAYSEYENPIWDVMEDAKALYLVRDMSRVSHHVQKYFTHSPTGFTLLYGTSLRVFYETPTPPAIEITVGRRQGYHPVAFYPGYMIKIDLPATFYKASGIGMDLDDENKLFKISIPKKKGKWIESINLQIKLFSPIDDPIFYWSAPMKTKS